MSPLESMKSVNAYAAWSMNEKERETSASGGVAAEMYKWAIDKEYKIIGAVQQDDFCVCHEMSDSKETISLFKNSKYVFSSAYPKRVIKKILKKNRI